MKLNGGPMNTTKRHGGKAVRYLSALLCSFGLHRWDNYAKQNGHHMCNYCDFWKENPMNIFDLNEDSIKDLPPELLKELSGDMQPGAQSVVTSLLEANNGKATIDQILIAVYRKHGDVWKRKMLQSVLLKLKTQGTVRFVSVKGKRGGFYELTGT